MTEEEQPAASPEFQAMVNANLWHDRSELPEFIKVILDLSKKNDFSWSWSRNWPCKYVDLRIDMRDGGFVMTVGDSESQSRGPRRRIDLAQLRYQRKAGAP